MIYTRKIDKELNYDVVVIGAGSAGCCAAISAARNNLKVLLVEKCAFLGGISTQVIDTFYGFYIPGKESKKVVGGIGDEIVEELKNRKAAIYRPNTYGAGTGITYEQEILKVVWEELVSSSHVDVLLHTIAIDVVQVNNRIESVILANKRELVRVGAKQFIDCSGDADIVFKAGYDFDGVGKSTVQSLTTTFRIGNIDVEKSKSFSKNDLWNWMKEANESQKFNLPREEGSVHITPVENIVATNMVRISINDPTDVEMLSRVEKEGRLQALEYFNFMKAYVPGYENSVLLNFSNQIGVRETRRIIGEYILQEEDVISARKFDDGILLCGAPIEDHNPSSTTKWKYLEEGEVYSLPYRCLIPKGSVNLLVAGRCISATHDAHASMRSIAQCMAMGEVAGVASAIAISDNLSANEIDVNKLRQKLMENNMILEV